jgi:hypothetical protein
MKKANDKGCKEREKGEEECMQLLVDIMDHGDTSGAFTTLRFRHLGARSLYFERVS